MFPTNKVPSQEPKKCQRIVHCTTLSHKRGPVTRCGEPAVTEYVYPDHRTLPVCGEHDIEVHEELRVVLGAPVADRLLWRHA